MAKKLSGLGKGLGAILTETPATTAVNTICTVELDRITVNKDNPRTAFDEEKLAELAENIRQIGIIQPVTVRQTGEGYELIAGERRFRASKMAGLKEIPAYIRTVGDEEMLQVALLENIQREDLNAIDVALALQRMVDELNLTHEAVSRKVSKKRATVTNYLRLLSLPPEVQLAIKNDHISMGHAKALVALPADVMRQVLDDIINEGLSVRQTEARVQAVLHPEPPAETEPAPAKDETPEGDDTEAVVFQSPNNQDNTFIDIDDSAIQSQLRDWFKAKVEVKRSPSGAGRITIHFRTDDELQQIMSIAEKISQNPL